MDDRKCENCRYWQDWKNRITACISTGQSSFARNKIELRLCKFVPHPTQSDNVGVYTDSEYLCGCWDKV